jgi:hypothetical protein
VVPDHEWKTVPGAERAQIEREHAAEVAKAEAERDAARVALTHARSAPAPRMAITAARSATVATGDEWATAVARFDQQKRAAITNVNAATVEWQRARLAFYARRAELAETNLAVLRSAYEVTRAKAVDHHRLGFDTYDTASYRGQLAHTQESWYAARSRATQAREELVNATARLTAAKDAYASLVRTGPTAPTSADDSLRLAGWNDRPLHERTNWQSRMSVTPSHYLTLGRRVAGN